MKSELPLNVFIAISNVSGYVKNAKCDCRASDIGRCCHVAALLLKLSDFSTKNSNIVIDIRTLHLEQGKKKSQETQEVAWSWIFFEQTKTTFSVVWMGPKAQR